MTKLKQKSQFNLCGLNYILSNIQCGKIPCNTKRRKNNKNGYFQIQDIDNNTNTNTDTFEFSQLFENTISKIIQK